MNKKYLGIAILAGLMMYIPSPLRARESKSVGTLTAPQSTIDVEVPPALHYSQSYGSFDVQYYHVDVKGWYWVKNDSPSEITRQVISVFELASRDIRRGKDLLHWSSNEITSYCNNTTGKIRSLISEMVLNNSQSPDGLLKAARYISKPPEDFRTALSRYLDLRYSKEEAEHPVRRVSVNSSYLLPGGAATRFVRGCYTKEDLQKLIDLQVEAAKRFIKAMESVKAKAGQKARKGKQGR